MLQYPSIEAESQKTSLNLINKTPKEHKNYRQNVKRIIKNEENTSNDGNEANYYAAEG